MDQQRACTYFNVRFSQAKKVDAGHYDIASKKCCFEFCSPEQTCDDGQMFCLNERDGAFPGTGVISFETAFINSSGLYGLNVTASSRADEQTFYAPVLRVPRHHFTK